MADIYQWTTNWAQEQGKKVWAEKQTTSTCDLAKSKTDFDFFVTDHQTQGRGRGSNEWFDNEEGGNLLCSWVFALSSAPQHITSPLVGLALYRAASKIWPELGWSLKAPNDLYIETKKTAGLLIESVSIGDQHRVVVSVGMNITNHPSIIETATHLQAKLDHPLEEGSWHNFLHQVDVQFARALQEAQHAQLPEAPRQELLEALNRNPLLTSPFDQVDENGSLYRKGQKVADWHTL